MTNPSIPPCPVCGTEPTAMPPALPNLPTCNKYLQVGCDCVVKRFGPLVSMLDWTSACNVYIGRALRTHGIHTIPQLTERLAPEPRVAVLESYGVSTADETACLIMLAARGSRTEIHTTEKLDDTLVLSVIKNLRSIGETQMFASLKRIAAQRGEG